MNAIYMKVKNLKAALETFGDECPVYVGEAVDPNVGMALIGMVEFSTGVEAPTGVLLVPTNGCAECDMKQADHCRGCHERLLQCTGETRQCVLQRDCDGCGKALWQCTGETPDCPTPAADGQVI